ncbi:PEP-CTERM sorting domain-containing protein [Aurantiacibacter aquimixticola]|uniref:PEP-CTERM sorting domain-containing protein n=1 Tax=Aurantiacibacter aquimixticola TaxID=1958945 RepID=A0A419RW06_9SPHN|nr:PEP-CTERM sorting domain-containing protein [Aurantiacibacter aquimixticola]
MSRWSPAAGSARCITWWTGLRRAGRARCWPPASSISADTPWRRHTLLCAQPDCPRAAPDRSRAGTAARPRLCAPAKRRSVASVSFAILTAAQVPEASSLTLFALGVIGVIVGRALAGRRSDSDD